MKIVLLILLAFIPSWGIAQKNTSPLDQGSYWDTAIRGSWNFAGVCYRNKLYYRKALYRDAKSFLLQNAFIESGLELGIAPFARASAFVTWQPILPFKITVKAGIYKDLIGDVAIDGSNAPYNQAYLPFTGLNPNIKPDRFSSQSLELEVAPVLTLGGKIGNDHGLALVYAPIMYFYHSFDNTSPNQYRFKSSEAIVVKKTDVFWKHNLLFGYQFLPVGLTAGISATIQQVQSIHGIFRAGIFGAFAYEKAINSKPYLIPYLRTQVGTWLVDRYMKHLFVFQLELGLKYKFH